MRDSLPTGQPDAKSSVTSPGITADRGKNSYTATITPRTLASDSLRQSAPGTTGEEKPKTSPARRHIPLRKKIEYAAGGCVALAILFLLLPAKWVNRAEPPAAIETDPDPETQPEDPEPAPDPAVLRAKTAAEWVEASVITGVRPTRIMINGKVCKLDEPIPPFQLRWIGATPGGLTFRGPDEAEYRRDLAK
jgi:hypothetical protein